MERYHPADTEFIPLWIDGHIKAAEALGKPLILEEFGKIASQDPTNITAVRDPVYRCALDHMQ